MLISSSHITNDDDDHRRCCQWHNIIFIHFSWGYVHLLCRTNDNEMKMTIEPKRLKRVQCQGLHVACLNVWALALLTLHACLKVVYVQVWYDKMQSNLVTWILSGKPIITISYIPPPPTPTTKHYYYDCTPCSIIIVLITKNLNLSQYLHNNIISHQRTHEKGLNCIKWVLFV